MKDRILAFSLFVIISGIAAGLCLKLYQSASQINATFISYTEEDLETIKYLSGIQSYFSENERLIYAYYAFSESRTDTLIRIAQIRIKLAEILAYLYADFSDTREYQVLSGVFDEFDVQLKRLDAVLNSGDASSGQAHAQLASLSQYGERITPVLEQLLSMARTEGEAKQQYVAEQLDRIVLSITAFVIITLLFLIFAGFSVYSMLKTDAARKKLARFPERSPIAVFSVDLDGNIIFANPASHRMAATIDPELADILPEDIAELITGLRSSKKSTLVHQYDLQGYVLSATLQLLPEFNRCHVYISDITSHVKAEQELQKLAYYDPVTDLPNNSLFVKDCDELITDENARFSVLVFSFVRFDLIARSADNAVIDELLKLAMQRVSSHLDEIRFCRFSRLYRLSGVNFAMLIKPKDDLLLDKVTTEFANHVQAVFASPLVLKRREFFLAPAIASSICPEDAITTDSLLAAARAAIDKLLKHNKSGYQPFNRQIRIQEQEWLETEKAIRKGIDTHEFMLFYQPKLSADKQSLKGVEALVRWNHDGQVVPPNRFIPVAEESGLILPLGDWILNEACRQAAEWVNSGITGFSVAVNVSAIQFHQPDFVEKVEQALSRHQLRAGYLELEITESVLMQDIEQHLESLNTLRKLGVELSLDDFGTGYSSMAYLRRLPISKLKIDRAFIANIQNTDTDLAMVRTMIEMAHVLGLKVIAEGVETEEQVTLLQQLQCDELQGFYYSKPVVAGEMKKWWKPGSVAEVHRIHRSLN